MMHHVRKGGLWKWEERERLTRVGENLSGSTAGSPYPSAWRYASTEAIRRAGSLRVPRDGHRPPLARVSSAESLRASDDVMNGPNSSDMPSAVKLWAKWVKNVETAQGGDAVSSLLRETDSDDQAAPGQVEGQTTADSSRQSSYSSAMSPAQNFDTEKGASLSDAYIDGSPAMMFLDGTERVPEDVREVLRAMVDPLAEERPTAQEVRRLWDEMFLDLELDGAVC